ncbi:MAG: hypothetical protein Q4F35_06955 [Akkermansia sp.]|nr:hypothetical protein [Akkermansia sp.]
MGNKRHREYGVNKRLASLCLLFSLLLHVGASALLLLGESEGNQPPRPEGRNTGRILKIKREPKKKKEPATSQSEEEKETPRRLPFAKTSAERPEEQPQQADFQGKRNARAEGESEAPDRPSEAPLPSMLGEEKEEINTLEQEHQDGPIEHDGKKRAVPAPAPAPDPMPGRPDVSPSAQPDLGTQAQTITPTEAVTTIQAATEQKDGELKLQTREEEEEKQQTPQKAAPTVGLPSAQGKRPIPPRPKLRRPVYDPSLADHAQPGFRTRERRTRSSGRFVLGRNPSLNVTATPLGRYEESVYRLIAYRWYAACDAHRGDIIPGRIIIAIRLNKSGSVDNMNLITRRGAGIIQQSFTFGAIRQAQLPPMPPAVQRELIGNQLELIFTFNFD